MVQVRYLDRSQYGWMCRHGIDLYQDLASSGVISQGQQAQANSTEASFQLADAFGGPVRAQGGDEPNCAGQ